VSRLTKVRADPCWPALRQCSRVHDSEDFRELETSFDTVLMINVLEHVPNEQVALRTFGLLSHTAGHAVILVPRDPGFHGSLDAVLGPRERYTKASFRESLERAGLRVGQLFSFNRCSVPGCWISGKLLGKKTFSKPQLKRLDTAMPMLKRIEKLWPWQGLSLIAVAVKE